MKNRLSKPFNVLSVLAVIGGLIMLNAKTGGTKTAPAPSVACTPHKYHTITVNNTNELLAYELRSDGEYCGNDKAFSAVIKPVDTAKDDYRNWSEQIVADIIRSTGINKLTVTVYDDYEAYGLSWSEGRFLTMEESAIVARHTIARYNGTDDPDGICYCELQLFPDADNRLRQSLSFGN